MEMTNIQEMCRQKKDALGLTQQDVVDRTGVPAATVKNFFSSASKAPSVYTVGPICRLLGISLDEYFRITDHLTPTEEVLNAQNDTLSAKNDTLRAHRDELEQQLESHGRTIDMMWHGVRLRNHVICVLLGIVVLLLVWCIYIDIHCADYGFLRW